MDVHVKEEILNEANIIVKDEQHDDYSVTVPLSPSENSPITQPFLKREHSSSEEERNDCACEESTKRRCISNDDGKQSRVKLEEDENDASMVAQMKEVSQPIPDDNLNLSDDCIDPFFSKEECVEEGSTIDSEPSTPTPQDPIEERPPIKRTPIEWAPLSPISGDDKPSFPRGKCGKSFPKQSDLTVHQIEHKSKIKSTISTAGFTPYSNRNQCLICGRVFTHNFTLKAHQLIHSQEKVTIPVNSTSRNAFSIREKPKKAQLEQGTIDKSFICSVCGKEFATESSCQQHEQTHKHETIQFPADSLPTNALSLGESLENSQLDQHYEEDTSYQCSTCQKGFKNHFSLKVHQRNHCLFLCSVCGKAFNSEVSCQQHKQTHKPEPKIAQEYTCLYCSRSYDQWKFLKSHLPHCPRNWSVRKGQFNCNYI